MLAPRSTRFPLFDAFRAIAALSIFVVHITFTLGTLDGGSYLWQLNTAVPLFYAISGFLLYRPFAKARMDARGSPSVRKYGVRRAFRILPAYWVALPIVAVVLGITSKVFSPSGIPTYFLFGQLYSLDTINGGIGPAWTICVEVTFYLFLPVWVWLLGRVRRSTSASFLPLELGGVFCLIAFSILWKVVAVRLTGSQANFSPVFVVLPAALDQLGAGMGVAVLSVWAAERREAPRFAEVIDRRPWLPWVVAGVAFYLLGTSLGPLGGSWGTRLIAEHELKLIIAVGIILPGVFGAFDRGRLRRGLRWRPLLWVGLVSYGFYLWHLPILHVLADEGLGKAVPAAVFGLIALALVCLVAAASWYGLERHAIAFSHRITGRSPRPRPEPEPSPAPTLVESAAGQR